MKIIEKIFSIKNDENKTHKIITLFGIKLKIKKNFKYLNNNAQINNFGINTTEKDVVILGNGPSLRDTFADKNDYDFIKNKDIFVVNSFVQSEQFFTLKPKYLCLMDPIYWSLNQSKENSDLIDTDYKCLLKVDWDFTIFMPNAAFENCVFKNLMQENKHIKFKFINTRVFSKHEKYRYIEYKQNTAMPAVQNVLVSCLYLAINIGYKNIFIYGADHSWHLSLIVNNDNIPCIIDKHCYDKENVTNYTPIYKDATHLNPFKISELFNAYKIVHEQYEILENYSKYMNSQIYNMSKFSCIDAFARKKIGDNNVK